MTPERELDYGEFRCILCGAISGPHPKDGLRECAACVEMQEAVATTVNDALSEVVTKLWNEADKYESNSTGMTDERGEVYDAGWLAGMRHAAERIEEWR